MSVGPAKQIHDKPPIEQTSVGDIGEGKRINSIAIAAGLGSLAGAAAAASIVKKN